MFLEIVNSEASIFSAEVDSIKVPGKNGKFQILNNHASIVSSLVKGKITVKGTDIKMIEDIKNVKIKAIDNGFSFDIESGLIEFNNNKASLLIE